LEVEDDCADHCICSNQGARSGAEILADEGLSGKDLERPALEERVARRQRGEVGHVVVWKLDRPTRRTRRLLSLVEDLFLARGIELDSVSKSLDTSTPHE
jgi:site-specific DNA recombinase